MTPQEPEPANTPGDDAPQPPTSVRQKLWFTVKAIEIRLRFIAVLVAIGLVIGYWDAIQNRWDKWTRPAAGEATALTGGEEFYCPMHPSVVRDSLDPGGAIPKCPICGMPMSKRKKGEATPLPEGVLSRVQLSPYRVQLAGIETAEITHRPLVLDVRALGVVAVDERNLSRIVVRAAGYVEKLFVNESFTQVRKGQPLAEIYSPELYTAARELLIAQGGPSMPFIDASRKKLELLGLAPEEIDEMVRTKQVKPAIVIRSPHSGHVFEKRVVEGDSVEAGQTLFEVADLSTVWIEGELYEQDAVALEPGRAVEVTVDAYPGRVFEGRVSLVHPHVETATRTLRVRCEIDNPKHELRPGMFATLRLKTPLVDTEPFRSLWAAEKAEAALARSLAVKLSDTAAGAVLVQSADRATAVTNVGLGAEDPPTTGDDLPLLPEKDVQPLINQQKVCPVTGLALGSMGKPLQVVSNGRLVVLCCAGCPDKFLARPDYYLARMSKVTEQGVLAVPEQSVIDTGNQKVVYVVREPGVFEGVPVTLGPRAEGYYAVIDGVLAGDRVAAAGAFLVDAETRLNPSASAAYFGASGGPSGGPSSASGSTSSPPAHAH